MISIKNGLVILLLALSTVACVKGPKGDTGSDGSSGKIVSTMNCGGTVSGLSGAESVLNGLEVEYDAVLTAGGDVYATGVIVDSGYQASGTAFYAADQNGAQTALVYVTADYHTPNNGGLWEISLNRSTLQTRVKYTDPSLNSGTPVEMTFNSAACTVQYW